VEINHTMAHNIAAFLGKQSGLKRAVAPYRSARLISLSQGFALLPISNSLQQEATSKFGYGVVLAFPQFSALTFALAELGTSLSMHTAVAYCETEYFVGLGSQGAVVWKRGHVAFGPLRSGEPREWEFSPVVKTLPGSGAISQALRILGVKRADAFDEFDALGLGKYRSNHEWLAVRS
jgi:hypothetical protein